MPKHLPKNMFWGNFSAKGLGQLINVEGMMNTDKYKAILKTQVLSMITRYLLYADGHVQEDPSPCQMSCKMRTLFGKSALEVLDWPGSSPETIPFKTYGI